MLFSISWRNIWRNKLRSAVIITAITLGLVAGIFASALFKGMGDQRVEKVIKTELSHIQIHQPEFRQANEMSNFIPNANQLAEELRKNPHVTGVSERISLFSMVASAETAAGVKISGIHPENEKLVSNLYSKLIEGNYFEEKRRYPVLLGRKLAEKLNVKLGSKVIITLQDLENNITAGAYRIVGIFDTRNNLFDEANIFIREQDLRKLINLPENASHELAILVDDNKNVPTVQQSIISKHPELETLSWIELSPEMNYLNEAMDLITYIFIVIILFALLFGILNTMLMVVLERVKEIGMLMAIGMNKMRVFMMIVWETVMLSLTGGVIGIFLATIITKYFETHKIDLTVWGEAYSDIGYDPYAYTSLHTSLLINITIMVIITGILASIYPAYRALKNDPADALRTE
jgi:ABC-type lipoprotein release transport system permease subunit